MKTCYLCKAPIETPPEGEGFLTCGGCSLKLNEISAQGPERIAKLIYAGLMAEEAPERMCKVAKMIHRFRKKPGNGMGGTLHIITDDQNVFDYHLESCREDSDADGIAILDELQKLSVGDRYYACGVLGDEDDYEWYEEAVLGIVRDEDDGE